MTAVWIVGYAAAAVVSACVVGRWLRADDERLFPDRPFDTDGGAWLIVGAAGVVWPLLVPFTFLLFGPLHGRLVPAAVGRVGRRVTRIVFGARPGQERKAS